MSAETRTVPDGTAPVRTLDSEELSELNDQTTAALAEQGWHAESDEDFEALNELTHTLAVHQVHIYDLLDTFVAEHQP